MIAPRTLNDTSVAFRGSNTTSSNASSAFIPDNGFASSGLILQLDL
jgi:hypothetical protein